MPQNPIDSRRHRQAHHGVAGSPEHTAWLNMRNRCNNPDHPEYPRYGGRGITVCPEWLESFQEFYRAVGPRPSPAHSLDRERNHEGYRPGNVRWTTIDVQNRNTRRNVFITYKGETMVVKDWATRLGLNPQSLIRRLRRGWSAEKAIETPMQPKEDRSLTIDGVTLTLDEWGKRYGIPGETLRKRIVKGWDPLTALTTPPDSKRAQNLRSKDKPCSHKPT